MPVITLSTLHILAHLILTKPHEVDTIDYYSHFTEEETKA